MIDHLQRERDLEHTHRMGDLARHLLKASLSRPDESIDQIVEPELIWLPVRTQA